MFVSLNLTPMVDMFTILVIFLIQLFKATGQVEMKSNITVPKAETGPALQDQGVVIVLYPDGSIQVDNDVLPVDSQGNELQQEIQPLVELLKTKKTFQEDLMKAAGITPDPTKPFDKFLLIQADIKSDFKRIRRIIYSANLAGWAKFKFMTTPINSKNGEGEGGAEGGAEGGGE
jgi:biopolymer transport protein ExbD